MSQDTILYFAELIIIFLTIGIEKWLACSMVLLKAEKLEFSLLGMKNKHITFSEFK